MISKEYKEGYEAYDDDVSIWNNPYALGSIKAIEWAKGWRQRKNELNDDD